VIAQPDGNFLVYFDGEFVPLAEARISILTHALHYGTGVFEGIRGYWNADQQELFLVRPVEHFERWRANCRILRIDIPHTAGELAALTSELIRRNGLKTNLYVRPLAWLSAPRIGVFPDERFAFAIVAFPYGDYLDSRNGLSAGIVSWRRIEDNAIPGRAKICGAYVNSALASDEARRNGYDEAIILNEDGHVAEGATCNIFVVRGRRLFTPPPTDNILEGITRDCVMQLARRELKLEVIERSIDRSELYVADEVFFTGTAVEIAPVVSVDRRPVGSGRIGQAAATLRRLYHDATHGYLPSWRQWVYPVYRQVPAGLAA